MSTLGVRACTVFPNPDLEDPDLKDLVLPNISKDTTPKAYDDLVARFPNFKVEKHNCFGFTTVHLAARMGNILLLKHIVEIEGKNLINMGTRYGLTSLLCASLCEDIAAGYLAAKELINLGADVNITTIKSISSDFPSQVTPLWVAAVKTKNLKLIKLLLFNGAILHPQNEIRVDAEKNAALKDDVTDLLTKAKDEIIEVYNRIASTELCLTKCFAIPSDVARQVRDQMLEDYIDNI
ncbi:MAG: hypothetical protein KR126chlam6_00070 [Candidatus Anoxychlamydiales bacterium]|nr:hypothetical protein [Candidatus Anoxychlamydiales bacterium]